jgi:hypothetical protein
MRSNVNRSDHPNIKKLINLPLRLERGLSLPELWLSLDSKPIHSRVFRGKKRNIMKLRQVLIPGWVALTLMLIFLTVAVAGGEGRLTQLEGRMDLLKGGKLPAVPPG